MPTEIAPSFEGFEHEFAHDVPVWREFHNVHAEFLEGTGIVLVHQRPIAPMVEANDKRLNLELCDRVPQLERAVLAAAER